MNPLLLSVPVVMFLGFGKKKNSRSGPRITILDCEGWDIPTEWWRQTAQKYWSRSLDRLETGWARQGLRGDARAIPTQEIARNLLAPELQVNPPTDLTWRCIMPPGVDAQTERPDQPDYWDGPPAILQLLQHIHEQVLGASKRYFEQGDRSLMLRLPRP